MKIFGFEINRAVKPTIENIDVKRPAKSDVYNNYVEMKTQIFRLQKDVGDYRTAVIVAENWLNPQRYLLYQVYQNIIIDSHLSAVLEQRKNLTLQKSFRIVDETGNEVEDKLGFLNSTWFRQFIDYSLESMFWGHSLIQFKDIINDKFSGIELIPRQFVKPELHIVGQSWTSLEGNDYLAEPFKNWCISVCKNPKDLGLLMKAAPLIIWKQAALGAWAEYQEVFGSPIRYLKTDVRDAATRASGIDMMQNMGSSSWAVVDRDDDLILSEQSKSDAYKVFDEMINRVNSEISKLILGQTGTTDEKSFVGSAEVQERTLETYAKNDEFFILSVLNDQLVPFMRNLGLEIGEGNRIEVAESDDLDIPAKADLLVKLLQTGKYYAEPEYIKETFGIEVIEQEVEAVEPKGVKDIENKLKDIYS